jgi:hypothetical protein
VFVNVEAISSASCKKVKIKMLLSAFFVCFFLIHKTLSSENIYCATMEAEIRIAVTL